MDHDRRTCDTMFSHDIILPFHTAFFFSLTPDEAANTSEKQNCRYRVLSMQAGFGLVESSFTRKMNSASIMTKNMMDLVMSAFVYVFLGCASGHRGSAIAGGPGSAR